MLWDKTYTRLTVGDDFEDSSAWQSQPKGHGVQDSQSTTERMANNSDLFSSSLAKNLFHGSEDVFRCFGMGVGEPVVN